MKHAVGALATSLAMSAVLALGSQALSAGPAAATVDSSSRWETTPRIPRGPVPVVVPKKWDYNLLTGVPRVAEAVMFEVRARMRAERRQVQVPGDSRWVTVPYRYDPKLRQLVYDDEFRRAYGVRFDPFGSKRPGWFSVSATMGIPTAEESALISSSTAGARPRRCHSCASARTWLESLSNGPLKADEYGDAIYATHGPCPPATWRTRASETR